MYFPDDVFKIIKSYVLIRYRTPLHYLAFKNSYLIENYYIEREFYEKNMLNQEFTKWFAYNSLLSYKHWWFSWHDIPKIGCF
tara:strand:- start:7842 stop:8087 length:246 start_codon:yes stop_codon:yes gene_type:complete